MTNHTKLISTDVKETYTKLIEIFKSKHHGDTLYIDDLELQNDISNNLYNLLIQFKQYIL